MKLVVLGGGAPSTPVLFEYLARLENPPRLHAVLAGPTRDHVEAVARACRVVGSHPALSVEARVSTATDWARGLAEAEVVLLQARVGGMAGRVADETIPLRYGIAGDSTVGPGGGSSGWRAWPVLERYFEEIGRWAPRTTVIILTSPVGPLVRLARRLMPRATVWGICELPASTLEEQAARVKAPLDEITHDYLGVNHLGWLHEVRRGGRDLLPDLNEAAGTGPGVFPDRACLAAHRAIPTRSWSYLLRKEESVARLRVEAGSRATSVAEFRRDAYGVFGSAGVEAIRGILQRRPAPWYPMAVGPLLAGLAGRPVRETLYLSTIEPEANRTMGLATDDVLELPFRFGNGGLIRASGPRPLADAAARLVVAQVQFERMVSQAIRQRDVAGFARAIAASPWRPADDREVGPMVEELLGLRPGRDGAGQVNADALRLANSLREEIP